MDAALKKRLAFAKQKLVEITAVAKKLSAGKCPTGKAPPGVAGTAAEEMRKYKQSMFDRPLPYEQRRQAQFKAFPSVRPTYPQQSPTHEYVILLWLESIACLPGLLLRNTIITWLRDQSRTHEIHTVWHLSRWPALHITAWPTSGDASGRSGASSPVSR